MHPFFCGLSTGTLFFLLAGGVGGAAALAAGRRAGISLWGLAGLVATVLVAFYVGSRTYAFGESALRYGFEARLFLAGGMRATGGMILSAAIFPLARRRFFPEHSALALGDLLVVPLCLTMAVARLGCFLHGCCYGTPSGLPWAVRFPHGSPAWIAHVSAALLPPDAPASLPIHPLQLYFAAWSLAVALVLLALRRWCTREGQLLLLFGALHEGGKGLLESLRAPAPELHLQVGSLAIACAAIAALIVLSWSVRPVTAGGSPAIGRTA